MGQQPPTNAVSLGDEIQHSVCHRDTIPCGISFYVIFRLAVIVNRHVHLSGSPSFKCLDLIRIKSIVSHNLYRPIARLIFPHSRDYVGIRTIFVREISEIDRSSAKPWSPRKNIPDQFPYSDH